MLGGAELSACGDSWCQRCVFVAWVERVVEEHARDTVSGSVYCGCEFCCEYWYSAVFGYGLHARARFFAKVKHRHVIAVKRNVRWGEVLPARVVHETDLVRGRWAR